MIMRLKNQQQTKNTISDGGSTTLYTATLFDLFSQFVCTVQTAYTATVAWMPIYIVRALYL